MDMTRIGVLVAAVEFVLSGFNQEPGCGGINMAIGVTNSVGRLAITFSRYFNDNGQGVSNI